MIWVDYTLSGLMLVCIVLGLVRGLVKEFFSLIFWLLATWVCLAFSADFSVFLAPSIKHVVVRMTMSFIALLAITLVFGGLVGLLLNVVMKTGSLSYTDRFGGMVLGAVRSLIVVTVVILLAGFTPLPKDSWWKQSTLIPPIQIAAVWLRDHLSPGMSEYIRYDRHFS